MPQKTPDDRFPGIDKVSNSAEKQRAKWLSLEFPKWVLACAPYAMLIVAVLLAYSNVYHNDFVYDDLGLIAGNKFLTSWRYIGTIFIKAHSSQAAEFPSPFYRPLQNLLYLTIYQATGPSTVAFHLLNVTLHALNACLLYTLGVRLGFQRIASLLAALLWALHPIHTEAVTFMSGTADPLCGVFFLLGILVLVPSFSCFRVIVACLLFTMALLTKETAVVFPLLAMGLLFYQSENRWLPHTYQKTWAFWLMTGFYLAARATVLNFSGFFGFYNDTVAVHATIMDRGYTFLATLPAYLQLLIWPTGLHMRMEGEFPVSTSLWTPRVMAGLGILAAAFTSVLWKPARRATPLAWGFLWAATVHIPQSGILVRSDAVFLEHWLYLPTMGLALGLGESLLRLSGFVRSQPLRPVLAGVALLIACLFGVTTFEQNKVWRDPIVFFTHILDCGDDTYKVRGNLGNAYQQIGQYEEAIRQFRVEVALSDNFAEAHYNLGTALINAAQVRYDSAGVVTIIRIDPGSPSLVESIQHFQRAVELDPNYYRAYDALAYVYGNHLGDHAKEAEYRAKAAAIRTKLGIE
jgi:hypothetical protein